MEKWLLSFFVLLTQFSWAQSIEQLEEVLRYPFSEVSSVDVQILDTEIAQMEKNNGLRFQTSVTNNDYAGLEFGSVWRASAGLNLNFLDEGLADRKNRIKSLEIEKEIRTIYQEHFEKDKNYAYIYNYIIYAFNSDKRNLLTQKEFLLSSLINKNYNLYYNHELNYEEILYLQGLNDECSILLKSIDHIDKVFEDIVDVDSLPPLYALKLPILDINIDSLIAHNPFGYLNQITDLKKEKLDYKNKLDNRQKLSLYFNVHYRPNFNGPTTRGTGFFNSYGVRYATPLSFDKKESKKLEVLERERIDAFQEDVVFNHNKELINLILDYNSKLRQYSNFNFKLRKLQEKKRVEGAIQRVSTYKAESRKDWKIELEILNVRYELLELKQLLYLSLLRVYNKAKLSDLTSYTEVKFFDVGHKRFLGERVLKVTESQAKKYNNDFVLSYLQKNNFQYVLWLGHGAVPEELRVNLYKEGIHLLENVDRIADGSIIQVPVSQFKSRSDMELWISEQMKLHTNSYLFFDRIDELLLLDSKTIGD